MRWTIALLGAAGLAACSETPASQGIAASQAQPFCTRTLGQAECFATPYALPDHPASLGDTPVRVPQPDPPLLKRLADDWRME